MTLSKVLDKTIRLVWGIVCGLMAVLVFTDLCTVILNPGMIEWTGKGRPPVWFHSTLNYIVYDILRTAWYAIGFATCFMKGLKMAVPHIMLTVACWYFF